MRSRVAIVLSCIWVLCLVAYSSAQTQTPPAQGGRGGGGWTLPPEAAAEKSPLKVDDKLLAEGKSLFASKCQRCHGPQGKGNGPDADPAHQADMDLTVAARATRNPDGVIFYRAWNGRSSPKMPAMSGEISKEQLWKIVAYVQTLRSK